MQQPDIYRGLKDLRGVRIGSFVLALILLASATLVLCGVVPGHHAIAGTARPGVVVTIKPVHSLVARIMEGVGTPDLLVKGTASPHTFAMKPSDARALNAARVFFRVSEEVEPFTAKIVKALPKSVSVVTLAKAKRVELLDKRSGEAFEVHHHDADDDHDDHKGHDDVEAHGHDDEGTKDGHVWLDPNNAKAMAEKITETLVAVFPADAERLKANATRLEADIDALGKEIDTSLAPVKDRPFVVFHDAYQYFEKRFGLSAVGSITVSPEVQPSALRLTKIREKLSTLRAACVFAEPQFSTNLVASVTEGTGARSGTLDPEGTTVAEGPAAYFDIMRGLSSGLKACLHQGS